MHVNCPNCQANFEVKRFSWWPILLFSAGAVLLFLFIGFVLVAAIALQWQQERRMQEQMMVAQAQANAARDAEMDARMQAELQRRRVKANLERAVDDMLSKVDSGLNDPQDQKNGRKELFESALQIYLKLLNDPDQAEQPAREQTAEIAMQVIRQAVTMGHLTAERLRTDANFAPLRSREDFQKLLKELEAKKE